MTKSTKQKKPSKKKLLVSSYRKKILEQNSVKNIQRYYNTSKFVPPVGNPYSWDVKKESVFDKVIIDPFGICFDPEEDMSFLPNFPEIPK